MNLALALHGNARAHYAKLANSITKPLPILLAEFPLRTRLDDPERHLDLIEG